MANNNLHREDIMNTICEWGAADITTNSGQWGAHHFPHQTSSSFGVVITSLDNSVHGSHFFFDELGFESREIDGVLFDGDGGFCSNQLTTCSMEWRCSKKENVVCHQNWNKCLKETHQCSLSKCAFGSSLTVSATHFPGSTAYIQPRSVEKNGRNCKSELQFTTFISKPTFAAAMSFAMALYGGWPSLKIS